jgi:hypothetical protein
MDLAMIGGQTALSVFGGISQGQSQKAMAEYNATISRNNAMVAEENVREAQRAGAMQEQQQRVKMATLLGEQRTGFGASGVDVNTGTAKKVQTSSASLGYQDLLTIRENTKAKRKQLRQQAVDFTNQANLEFMKGSSAQSASNIGAMSSFLDGASSFYGSGKSSGMWGGSSSMGSGVSYGSNPMASGGGGYIGGGSMTTLGR